MNELVNRIYKKCLLKRNQEAFFLALRLWKRLEKCHNLIPTIYSFIICYKNIMRLGENIFFTIKNSEIFGMIVNHYISFDTVFASAKYHLLPCDEREMFVEPFLFFC